MNYPKLIDDFFLIKKTTMLKRNLFAIILIVSITHVYSQEYSCSQFIDYVESNGQRMSTNDAPLMTKWLGDVVAYSMVEPDPSLYKFADMIEHAKSDGVYVVVAEFLSSELFVNSKKYVFCGVPISNWEEFEYSFYLRLTRGETFHKYIRNYTCNCY